MKSSTSDLDSRFRSDLQLSARRGPETELYDIAGVHLVSSIHAESDLLYPRASLAVACKDALSLKNCWRVNSDNFSDEGHRPVVLANPSFNSTERSLGRLPTKASPGTGRSHHERSCLKSGSRTAASSCGSSSSPSKMRKCRRGLGCISNKMGAISYSPGFNKNFYEYIFTLCYGRYELSIFLIMLLFLSLFRIGLFITNGLFNQTDGSRFLLITEWCRVGFLATSSILSVACLVLLTSSYCTGPSDHLVNVKQADKEDSNKVEQHVSYLLITRRILRILRRLHAVTYLSCILLVIGCLSWPYPSRTSNSLSFNDTSSQLCIQRRRIVGNTDKNSSPIYIRGDRIPHPSADLWIVLWITVAVHGLFDLEEFFSINWRYLLTILTCFCHALFTNLDFIYDHRLHSAHEHIPCEPTNSTHRFSVLHSITWWDSRELLIARCNVVLFLGFLAAHLVGRILAVWTKQHRYRLFTSTWRGQAKLDRLKLVQDKLDLLSSYVVPISLAPELARDLIAGYLAWRSPLVIYLRNISFLSVEVTGLSHLASTIATSSNSVLSKQFVQFTNDLFCQFDQLAKREGCYRIRLNASEYLCLGGYPDSRVDHARSCVDLGLQLVQLVRKLSEAAEVNIELKVAVHTGTAYAAVLGHSRLGFDVTGEDVQFTGYLRQAATRPDRVLVSWATFNQLPEGFRGEAGPIFEYPHPVADRSQTVGTYFVQPRHSENGNEPISDRLKLIDLDLADSKSFHRLVSKANAICRSSAGDSHQDTPLDYFFHEPNTASELLPQLRSTLLETLTTLAQEAEHRASLTKRNTSTCELLAMAAVTMAQNHERDTGTAQEKLVPCQRRAGRLRNRCSNDETAMRDSAEGTPLRNGGNSLTTSLLGTVANTNRPELSEFVNSDTPIPMTESSWPLQHAVGPPGYPRVDWFCSCCRSCRPKSGLPDADVPEVDTFPVDEAVNMRFSARQLARIVTFLIIVLLPMIITLAAAHLLSVSRSVWMLSGFAGILIYFGLLWFISSLIKHLSWPSWWSPHCIQAISVGSVLITAVVPLLVLSLCQPVFQLHSITNTSNASHRNPPHLVSITVFPQFAPIVPIREQYILTLCLVALIPAICFQATLYAVSVTQIDHGPMDHRLQASLTHTARFWTGFMLFLLQVGVYLWLSLYGGLDAVIGLSHQFRSTEELQLDVSYQQLSNSLVGLLFFWALAFLLPRSVHCQSILLAQWLHQNECATQRIHHTWSALLRLLLSTAPPVALLPALQGSKTAECYSKSELEIGLAVIQLTVCSTMNADASADATEPTKIADRLRLINHLIGIIDQQAEGKPVDQSDVDTKPRLQHTLCKVYTGGACVAYAVGSHASDAITNPLRRTTALTRLLTFAENVIEACEHLNLKTKPTENAIHARIAMHSGPAVIGLIGKQRPAYTIWGDPLNVCLYLLQESQVPELRRQHLLLATDEVINPISVQRLSSGVVSGRSLVWRCVDTRSGVVLPSTSSQARRVSMIESPSRPLHFCSILSADVRPDKPSTSSALIGLAKRASARTSNATAQRIRQQFESPVCVVSQTTPQNEMPPDQQSLSPKPPAPSNPITVPPPPLHHRVYPSAQAPDSLVHPSVTVHSDAQSGPPVPKHGSHRGELAVRSGPKRSQPRRDVFSQYTPNSHDYSIVNVEPTSPKLTTSHRRPQTQLFQHTNGAMNAYRADCVRAIRYSEKTESALLIGNGLAGAQALVPVSPSSHLSSTSSFLLAEQSCAEKPVNPTDLAFNDIANGLDTASHHNPLYTDNEYDSMTESQHDLANIDSVTSRPPVPRHIRKHRLLQQNGTQHDSPTNGSMSGRTGNHYDLGPNGFSPHGSLTSDQRDKLLPKNTTPPNDHSVPQPFDFPAIRRPPSPVYHRDSVLRFTPKNGSHVNGRHHSPYVSGSPASPAYLSDHPPCPRFPRGIPPNQMALSYFSMETSRCSDYNALSFRCNVNAVNALMKEKRNSRSRLSPASRPGQSDSDCTDAEYRGTMSLSPLNMAAQASSELDGLAICDEQDVRMLNGNHFATLNVPLPPTDPPPTPAACMTDSLLANPDLEENNSLAEDDVDPNTSQQLPIHQQIDYLFDYHNNEWMKDETAPILDPQASLSGDPVSRCLPSVAPVSMPPNFNCTVPCLVQCNPEYDNLHHFAQSNGNHFSPPLANNHHCSSIHDQSVGSRPDGSVSCQLSSARENGLGHEQSCTAKSATLELDCYRTTAGSQASTLSDQQRSEYDNVHRSTSCSGTTSGSMSPARPRLLRSRRRKNHGPYWRSDRSARRKLSEARRPKLMVKKGSVFSAEIVAEARRISQKFRTADGIPDYGQARSIVLPPSLQPIVTNRNPVAFCPSRNLARGSGTMTSVSSDTEDAERLDDRINVSESESDIDLGLENFLTNPVIQPRSLSSNCLDDLMDHITTSPASSSSSSDVDNMGNADSPHATVDPLRRTKSSRYAKRSGELPGTSNSPRFRRLQRRAAKVRSLIPADLQPYILPSCMSSLSRSSNDPSSTKSLTPESLSMSVDHHRLRSQKSGRLTRCLSDSSIRQYRVKQC